MEVTGYRVSLRAGEQQWYGGGGGDSPVVSVVNHKCPTIVVEGIDSRCSRVEVEDVPPRILTPPEKPGMKGSNFLKPGRTCAEKYWCMFPRRV